MSREHIHWYADEAGAEPDDFGVGAGDGVEQETDEWQDQHTGAGKDEADDFEGFAFSHGDAADVKGDGHDDEEDETGDSGSGSDEAADAGENEKTTDIQGDGGAVCVLAEFVADAGCGFLASGFWLARVGGGGHGLGLLPVGFDFFDFGAEGFEFGVVGVWFV